MPALNFQKQFAEAVETGKKRQTIRAKRKDGRMPATPGAPIKLYTGMRTKACRLLMEADCYLVKKIEMVRRRDGKLDAVVAGYLEDQEVMWTVDTEGLAKDDGFENAAAMADWFEKTHGFPFSGWVIRWKPPSSVSEKPVVSNT